MIDETMTAIGLAFTGAVVLVFSLAVPAALVFAFNEKPNATAAWLFQALSYFGIICLALSAIIYLLGKKKKK